MSFESATTSSLVELQSQIFQETQSQSGPSSELFPWLIDRRNLDAAWERISTRQGASTPGPDGQTCSQVVPRLSRFLSTTADWLVTDFWEPTSPLEIDVPKPDGSMRRLGILNVRDRLVHTSLKQVLEPVLEPVFQPTSFGFRPGRSVPDALRHAAAWLTSHAEPGEEFFAASLDIRDCFGSIEHRRLIEVLSEHVTDSRILSLVERILESGGHTCRRLFGPRRRCGLVQGSSLSPLLCNLFLHQVDTGVASAIGRLDAPARCLRYADDLLILSRSAADVRRLQSHVQQALRRIGLSLGSKTSPRPVRLSRGIEWLGLRLRSDECGWSDGNQFVFDIPDAKVKKMLRTIGEMTSLPDDRLNPDAFELSRWVVSLNEQLKEWRSVYRGASNAATVFQALDEQAQEGVARLIAHCRGLKRRQVEKLHRAKLARGFRTWEIDGTRLVRLAATPPRQSRAQPRRPHWMNRRRKPQQLPTTSAGGVQ